MTTKIPTRDDFIKYNKLNEFGIFEPENKLIAFQSYLDLIRFVDDGWFHLIEEGWSLEFMWDARDIELFYVWNNDMAGAEAGTKVTITNYSSDGKTKQRTYTGKGRGLTTSTVTRLLKQFDKVKPDRRSSTFVTGNSALFFFKV